MKVSSHCLSSLSTNHLKDLHSHSSQSFNTLKVNWNSVQITLVQSNGAYFS